MEETANRIPYEIWEQISRYFRIQQLCRIMSVHRAFYDTAMNELYRSIDWREFDRNMAKTLICMHRNPALAARVRTLHIAAPMLEALYSVAQDSSEGTIKTFENIQSQHLAVDGLGKESTPETAGTQVEKRLRVGNEKPSDAREWMETALSNMVNIETCTFNSTQVPTAAEPATRVLQKTLSQCVRKLVLDCGRASELQMLVSSSFQLRHLEDLGIILRFHPDTSSTQRHLDQKFLADRFAPFVNALHPTLVSLSVIATHGIDYSTFFDGIDVLPHLHQLFLWLDFDDQEFSKPNSLIHFLRENSSQLTSVTLRSLPSSDSTWRKFASGLESDPQIFSGLRSLTIFRLPLDLKFVSSLIQRSKNTLKCLHVEQCPLELQQVRQLVSTLGETPVISLELEVNIFSPAVLDLLSKELPWLESLDITFDKVGSVHVDSRGEFVTTEFDDYVWTHYRFTSLIATDRYKGWALSELRLRSHSYNDDSVLIYQILRSIADATPNLSIVNGKSAERWLS